LETFHFENGKAKEYFLWNLRRREKGRRKTDKVRR
jgi:hypothetical protein